jgi:PKD repeat protein
VEVVEGRQHLHRPNHQTGQTGLEGEKEMDHKRRSPRMRLGNCAVLAILLLLVSSRATVQSRPQRPNLRAASLDDSPQVIAVGPPRNALAVEPTANITATFDTDMDAGSLTTQTVIAHGAFTGRLAAGVAHDPASRTATLDPAGEFKPGEVAWSSVTGDALGADGTSTISDERTASEVRWIQRTVANHPFARQDHAMAYDSKRGVTVLFGGKYLPDGGWQVLGDTWEWDGVKWTQLYPANHPPARCWHTMVYDTARQVVVLFGGYDGSHELSDTWEWDGTNWIQRMPAHHPTARYWHTMAYDSDRGVTVMYGGQGFGQLTDTWEWDGVDWIERCPIDHPGSLLFATMTYDSDRRVVVMFGGSVSGSMTSDTWEWNGNDWVKRTPLHCPSARFWHAIAYDSARQVVVLFGGKDNSGHSSLDDTWEWDGNDWAERTPTSRPVRRHSHAMVYDCIRGVAVVFGGYKGSYGVWLDDTWEYVPPAVAAFEARPNYGFAPLTVRFIDQSIGAITTREWDFGDGGSSNLQDPVYEYVQTGIYTVSLAATGLNGSDVEIKESYIHVWQLAASVYLPLAMRNYVNYFEGPWEEEPNDDALTQANGPLVSGLTYYGTFQSGADKQDYYFIDLTTAHTVELWLTNIGSGHNYNLVLRDAALNEVGYSAEPGNADEHILTGIVPAGRYYIQVFNYSQTGSWEAYHLQAMFGE